MSTPEALLMPEILAWVATFLTKSQTATCMRVCKQWKSEFERATWSSVEYDSNPKTTLRQPSIEQMKQNAHHIQHLTYPISDSKPARIRMVRCPNLRTVHFKSKDGSAKHKPGFEGTWGILAEMIENLPLLHKIKIDGGSLKAGVTEKFLNAMQTCLHLDVLETKGLHFIEKGEYFRTTVPLMQQLATQDDTFQVFEWEKDDVSFPKLRHLELRGAKDVLQHPGRLEWIVRCPNLSSLVWEDRQEKMPVEEFCKRVPEACPALTSLELLSVLTDQEMALIQDAFPKIEKFVVEYAVGPKSLEALRRHFPTLTELKIKGADRRPSRTIHDILSNCPNLLKFTANEIRHEDLYVLPWVCSNLQVLDINIRMPFCSYQSDLMHAQTQFYNTLAALTKLESLTIGIPDEKDPLDISVRAGIGRLKTLTKLKHFHGRGTLEKAVSKRGFEVVGWMLENWKQLETLEGYIPPHDPAYNQIKNALEERGIKHVNVRPPYKRPAYNVFQDVYDDTCGGMPYFGGYNDDIDAFGQTAGDIYESYYDY